MFKRLTNHLAKDTCFEVVNSRSQDHPILWATQDIPSSKHVFVFLVEPYQKNLDLK
jgi:hypothetical protein